MKLYQIPAPDALREDVEYFRIVEYDGEAQLDIQLCPVGLPGLVFQHRQGYTMVQNIVTSSGHASGEAPILFVYGQAMERSVIHQAPGAFTMTQVVLKPNGLHRLFDIYAPDMCNRLVSLGEFTTLDLIWQLMEASSTHGQVALITEFLLARQKRTRASDLLVETSLRLIEQSIQSVSVKMLLEHLSISERQFEKRFMQVVGISPQFYIRLRRFNAAVRLIHSGRYEKLTDVAFALNFYDQSHFIRDIKAFSGLTPKNLSQRTADFLQNQVIGVQTSGQTILQDTP